ncbi:tripartite tricarboxylate transporter TctB family protein [Intrasporangium sp.]|jgi:hypothetical protein|uniref:tripartite tricarboxylate transporter TctB family protein n=1 Tax=Intrasporangium sp. TaxID=1925024 RepID=UPI0033654390
MSTTHSHHPSPTGGEPDILEEIRAEVAADLEEERPPHAGPVTQVVAGLAALALGVSGLLLSLGFGLGSLTEPGPGLWPFIVSVAVTALSVALLVLGRHDTDTEKFTRSSILTAVGVASLVCFGLLLPVIGFEVPALLVMLIWTRFLGGETWRMSVLISVLTVAAFYALFVLALQIPLPRLI